MKNWTLFFWFYFTLHWINLIAIVIFMLFKNQVKINWVFKENIILQ